MACIVLDLQHTYGLQSQQQDSCVISFVWQYVTDVLCTSKL